MCKSHFASGASVLRIRDRLSCKRASYALFLIAPQLPLLYQSVYGRDDAQRK